LGTGFASCDLLIEFLLTPDNVFQCQRHTPRLGTTVDKKSPRPYPAGYLPNEFVYLSPRRDPFSPGDERDHGEYHAD
jgi:hypothetical protein